MRRFILCLIPISIAFSYSSNKQFNKPGKDIGLQEAINSKTEDGIKFDFRIDPLNAATATFVIHATLYNDNKDTANFLSSTCEGEPYSIRYDTSKFEQTNLRICNISQPKIIKIAPKGQHNFKTYFRVKDESTTIQLGFDFYAVDRTFDLATLHTGSMSIFHRPKKEQHIIWSGEKALK